MEESILSADELYIADDLYESLTEEKQKILSNMSQMNLDKLHNDKSNKLNKLKLLLYQKFLNILFVILAQNFQGNLKQAMEKLKLGKIRGYKIQTNNKVNYFPFKFDRNLNFLNFTSSL